MESIYRIHYMSDIDPEVLDFPSIEEAAKVDTQAGFSFNHLLEHGDISLIMGQTVYEIVRLH